MAGYICPFCNSSFSLIDDTYKTYYIGFDNTYNIYTNNAYYYADSLDEEKSMILLHFYRCPTCNKTSISITGIGDDVNTISQFIYPNSNAKQFPDYIPLPIRSDYEEACAILNLSPKASATLSRRCLQGMIRDFHQIKPDTLFKEINAIKDKIPTAQWKAIDALRKIGNIGAHMEKDVNLIVDIDPSEAEKLIRLIEVLIDKWYIARHDEEQLLQSIVDTGQAKQNQRNVS